MKKRLSKLKNSITNTFTYNTEEERVELDSFKSSSVVIQYDNQESETINTEDETKLKELALASLKKKGDPQVICESPKFKISLKTLGGVYASNTNNNFTFSEVKNFYTYVDKTLAEKIKFFKEDQNRIFWLNKLGDKPLFEQFCRSFLPGKELLEAIKEDFVVLKFLVIIEDLHSAKRQFLLTKGEYVLKDLSAQQLANLFENIRDFTGKYHKMAIVRNYELICKNIKYQLIFGGHRKPRSLYALNRIRGNASLWPDAFSKLLLGLESNEAFSEFLHNDPENLAKNLTGLFHLAEWFAVSSRIRKDTLQTFAVLLRSTPLVILNTKALLEIAKFLKTGRWAHAYEGVRYKLGKILEKLKFQIEPGAQKKALSKVSLQRMGKLKEHFEDLHGAIKTIIPVIAEPKKLKALFSENTAYFALSAFIAQDFGRRKVYRKTFDKLIFSDVSAEGMIKINDVGLRCLLALRKDFSCHSMDIDPILSTASFSLQAGSQEVTFSLKVLEPIFGKKAVIGMADFKLIYFALKDLESGNAAAISSLLHKDFNVYPKIKLVIDNLENKFEKALIDKVNSVKFDMFSHQVSINDVMKFVENEMFQDKIFEISKAPRSLSVESVPNPIQRLMTTYIGSGLGKHKPFEAALKKDYLLLGDFSKFLINFVNPRYTLDNSKYIMANVSFVKNKNFSFIINKFKVSLNLFQSNTFGKSIQQFYVQFGNSFYISSILLPPKKEISQKKLYWMMFGFFEKNYKLMTKYVCCWASNYSKCEWIEKYGVPAFKLFENGKLEKEKLIGLSARMLQELRFGAELLKMTELLQAIDAINFRFKVKYDETIHTFKIKDLKPEYFLGSQFSLEKLKVVAETKPPIDIAEAELFFLKMFAEPDFLEKLSVPQLFNRLFYVRAFSKTLHKAIYKTIGEQKFIVLGQVRASFKALVNEFLGQSYLETFHPSEMNEFFKALSKDKNIAEFLQAVCPENDLAKMNFSLCKIEEQKKGFNALLKLTQQYGLAFYRALRCSKLYAPPTMVPEKKISMINLRSVTYMYEFYDRQATRMTNLYGSRPIGIILLQDWRQAHSYRLVGSNVLKSEILKHPPRMTETPVKDRLTVYQAKILQCYITRGTVKVYNLLKNHKQENGFQAKEKMVLNLAKILQLPLLTTILNNLNKSFQPIIFSFKEKQSGGMTAKRKIKMLPFEPVSALINEIEVMFPQESAKRLIGCWAAKNKHGIFCTPKQKSKASEKSLGSIFDNKVTIKY